MFYGCQADDYSFGDIITPSNIQINAELVGADANNPNGDGSGEVKFTVTADNAVSYKFVYEGAEYVTLSGEQSIIFSKLGLNTYTVTAVASGTAGVTSSKTIQVDVLATYSPPNDLTAKLYGFDPANPTATTSRTWRIKSSKPGHFGLGPVGGTTPVEWYGAGVDEKAGVGMYDDRFIFSSDGTYTHTTNGATTRCSQEATECLPSCIAGTPPTVTLSVLPMLDVTSLILRCQPTSLLDSPEKQRPTLNRRSR